MKRAASVRITALALTLAVMLVGCSTPIAEDASSATPTTQSTPTITPTPAATPTIPPSPNEPSTWIVTDNGMGPFTLGMPLAAAATSLAGLTAACDHAYNDKDGLWIASWNNPGRLDEVTWYAYDTGVGPRTADGIGIGSTVEEVIQAHPDAVHSFENHDYLQSGRLFFGYDADTRVIDTIGVTTDAPPWEYCG